MSARDCLISFAEHSEMAQPAEAIVTGELKIPATPKCILAELMAPLAVSFHPPAQWMEP